MSDRDDLLPPYKGTPSEDCSKRLLDDLGKFSTYIEKDYGVRKVRWNRPATGGLAMHFEMPDHTSFRCEFTEKQIEQVQGGLQYQTFFRQMDSGLRAHIAEWERQRKLARAAESPDIGEYIIGYRQWKLTPDTYVLHPQSRGRSWVIGDWSEAICDQDMGTRHGASNSGFFVPSNARSHLAPDPQCECGLYALHAPAGPSGEHGVTGAVIAKGLIEVHDTGFRAQYAKPALFALPSETMFHERVHGLAKAHGIQAVPWENLVSAAQEWGKPVPESEYPCNNEIEFFM